MYLLCLHSIFLLKTNMGQSDVINSKKALLHFLPFYFYFLVLILLIYSETCHHTEIRLWSLPSTRDFLHSSYRKCSIYVMYHWNTRPISLFPPFLHIPKKVVHFFFFLTGLLLLSSLLSVEDYFNTYDFKMNASATVMSWEALGTPASPAHTNAFHWNGKTYGPCFVYPSV